MTHCHVVGYELSSGSGGGEVAMAPPGPVKISHKKMAAEGGRIGFMFLAPSLPGRWILYWNFNVIVIHCTDDCYLSGNMI